jgi:hypothetical protein
LNFSFEKTLLRAFKKLAESDPKEIAEKLGVSELAS